MNGPKILFTIQILGGIPITQTTVSSFLVMVILCVSGYLIGRKLTKRPGKLQVIVEYLVDMLYNMVGDTMGQHNRYWTPYIGALFLSSICGTYIGMTGFLRSSTADLSTTVTWAVMTSVLVWACNIKNNGFWNWLKGFAEPIPVMLPMNIVSEIAQPISMAFRHFGNIAGGAVLTSLVYSALATATSAIIRLICRSSLAIAAVVLALGAFLFFRAVKKGKGLMKYVSVAVIAIGVFSFLQYFNILTDVPILSVGIPAVLSLYFDIFSGLVQALVFSLLTMVYVGNACPPPEKVDNK